MTIRGLRVSAILLLTIAVIAGVGLAAAIRSGPKPLEGLRKWLATAIEAGAGTLSLALLSGWLPRWSNLLFPALLVAWTANVAAAVVLGWKDDRRLFGRLAVAAHVLLVTWVVGEFVYFICCDPSD
jgi:hypothetical protein